LRRIVAQGEKTLAILRGSDPALRAQFLSELIAR